jgi:hypothetical protein
MLAALRQLGKITIEERRTVHLWAVGSQSRDERLNGSTISFIDESYDADDLVLTVIERQVEIAWDR